MKIAVISFTSRGYDLSRQLRRKVKEFEWEIYSKCESVRNKLMPEDSYVEVPLQQWTGEQFEKHRTVVFVGATGIAVRAIAPFVDNKLTDEPVLSVDEKGNYVIPLLSGHVGGANAIAERIAKGIKGEPVITTATDINDKLAIDVFAKENEMTIKNKEAIALVSAKVLEKKPVRVSVPTEYLPDVYIAKPKEPLPERAILILEPKEYVLGIGCKKGKTLTEIEAGVREALASAQIPMEQVGRMASIDLKKSEEGLLGFSQKYRIPFVTFGAEELKEVQGEFSESSFVSETVGVGNVCERSAMVACEGTGRLVVKKLAKNGVTVAVAKRKWSIHLDEE